jgi:hypothetical protein
MCLFLAIAGRVNNSVVNIRKYDVDGSTLRKHLARTTAGIRVLEYLAMQINVNVRSV